MVFLFTISLVLFGLYAVFFIPVGAVPDVTNNQVQVITVSENLSTQDVEQFITYPVELEMGNLPGVTEIRSISKYGLSVVTIVFEEDMGTYLPRQLISEKLKTAAENIPEGFGTPEMGPISTGLGEIYQYILDVAPQYRDRYSPMELRTIQDWIVKRQLTGIPGVVEVNTWGGFMKQYEIAVNPERISSYGISLLDIYNALKDNNGLAGGAYIEKDNFAYYIRGNGMIDSNAGLEKIRVKTTNGYPILLGDVAKIRFGHANRFGAITANAEGEKVMGQIMMLKDANSKEVIQAVKDRVAEVQKSLPEGVYINPVLERSELIEKTTFTIVENLLLGCLIVILVVIILLGNLRSAFLIASIIPLSLLFTISMMYILGIDANLMSLGALDFGIIIDGAVIIVEFVALSIAMSGAKMGQLKKADVQDMKDKITFNGASKMINSAIYGQLIILIVLIPVFVLEGVEGKMFRPMASAFSFAIIGAMILGLTWIPAASALFLKPKQVEFKWTTRLMKWIYSTYKPVLNLAYSYKKTVFSLSILVLFSTAFLFTKMGGEFVPTLDEGDFVIQPVLKTGTSLTKTIELTTKMEDIVLSKFPNEVDQIVCRIGAAEVPTDPMSMEEIDMIIKLHPKKSWKKAASKEALADLFKEELMIIPGIDYEFTQPIEMRFNELITGVRADLAIKLFGEDLDYLNSKANEIKSLIDNVDGAADVIVEKTAGLPQMVVDYKRNMVSHYGLSIAELNQQMSSAFGGSVAGKVFDGEKRFDLVVRLHKEYRKSIDDIRNLKIGLPNGGQIPLSQVARIYHTKGPAKISRENTQRRVVVSVNVRNRDLESVKNDVEAILSKDLKLKAGYYIRYGGQFENLESATNRLLWAVPISLLLIFVFLHFAFNSFKEALLIFTAVPLSAVGGILLLHLRDMPFSVSAGIGFIALFGVAVLNGIVLIEHMRYLKQSGMKNIKELVFKATKERLRPVLLTASTAAFGFLPMALSTSAGAEVQRPLATVVIGGLVTSTLLTMILLPLLYAVFHNVKGMRLFPPKFIKVATIVAGFFLVVPNLNAQIEINSLDELLELGYANNRGLKSAKLSIDQAKALEPAAFVIEPTQIYYDFDENNIADNGYPLNVFGIEQTFQFPTVYAKGKKMSRISTNLAEIDYEIEKRKLSREMALKYIDIQYLLNKRDYLNHIDSILALFVSSVEKEYELGAVNSIDKINAYAKRNQLTLVLKELDFDIQKVMQSTLSLLNADTSIIFVKEDLAALSIQETNELNPWERKFEQNIAYKEMEVRLNKNTLWPSITLGYYNGTNWYENAENYNGYSIGLGIPIFFGEKRSQIKSGKISIEIEENRFEDYNRQMKAAKNEWLIEIEKQNEMIKNYEQNANPMYEELLRATESFRSAGEIGIYKYLISLETAIRIQIDYLNSLRLKKNALVEIKYLTF
jgi:cobalt-zinc-cadmium resistance protein CzcA